VVLVDTAHQDAEPGVDALGEQEPAAVDKRLACSGRDGAARNDGIEKLTADATDRAAGIVA
jgi:hypothetical protein